MLDGSCNGHRLRQCSLHCSWLLWPAQLTTPVLTLNRPRFLVTGRLARARTGLSAFAELPAHRLFSRQRQSDGPASRSSRDLQTAVVEHGRSCPETGRSARLFPPARGAGFHLPLTAISRHCPAQVRALTKFSAKILSRSSRTRHSTDLVFASLASRHGPGRCQSRSAQLRLARS